VYFSNLKNVFNNSTYTSRTYTSEMVTLPVYMRNEILPWMGTSGTFHSERPWSKCLETTTHVEGSSTSKLPHVDPDLQNERHLVVQILLE
jgi:hypothetical protein